MSKREGEKKAGQTNIKGNEEFSNNENITPVENNNTNTNKNRTKKISLWLVGIGAFLLITGLIFVFFGNKCSNDYKQKLHIEVPKNLEEAMRFLRNNSNYYDIVKEYDFNSYWPKEYFEISIAGKAISYYNDSLIAEAKYKNHSAGDNNIKILSEDSSNITFEKFPDIKNIRELVEKQYIDAVDNKEGIENKTKRFSLIYNALAGHNASYLVLGRNRDNNNWKYYQPSDFPRRTLPTDDKLHNIVREYVKQINSIYSKDENAAKNIDSSQSVIPLCESVKNLIDSISVKAISFDNRGDKIWYGNDSADVSTPESRTKLIAPYKYEILNNKACGWVVSDDAKENLYKATEYYKSRRFIDEDTYNKLDSLKWNDVPEEPGINTTLKLIGSILITLGALVLLFRLTLFIIKKYRINKKKETAKKTKDSQESYENQLREKNDKIKELLEINNRLQAKLNELRYAPANKKNTGCILYDNAKNDNTDYEEIVKNFKQSKEYNENLEDAAKDAVNAFKQSKEYKNELKKAAEDAIKENSKITIKEYKNSEEYRNILKEARKDATEEAVNNYKEGKDFRKTLEEASQVAVKDFKNSKEYKKLIEEAKNWRTLSSYTSEDKVIKFLDETHNLIQTFPKLNMLSDIYNKAKAEGKNERELVAVILAALDKQTGKPTGLQAFYKDLVANAAYGVDVRDRFESIKAITQKFGERKEYMQIVSHGTNLSIWERLAVMLWAMECTNEVLKVFGKGNFAADVIKHAAETHKDDIMQIFATRIFNKYIADQSVTTGALTGLRESMMADKLAEVQSKYGVSMSASQAYRDFVESLDSTHDKLKANVAFINMMKAQLVDDFISKEREITEKGVYMSYVVAMGLHMCDYIRYMSGNSIDYCPNMRFVLSGLNPKTLDSNTEFRYKDPAYSGEYSNRIYEWMKESGIGKLKALVGNKYIMP